MSKSVLKSINFISVLFCFTSTLAFAGLHTGEEIYHKAIASELQDRSKAQASLHVTKKLQARLHRLKDQHSSAEVAEEEALAAKKKSEVLAETANKHLTKARQARSQKALAEKAQIEKLAKEEKIDESRQIYMNRKLGQARQDAENRFLSGTKPK